jgi:hypothetical protein
MDFVDWCDIVLRKVIEITSSSLQARQMGVHDTEVINALFGDGADNVPGFWGSPKHQSVHDALSNLAKVGLIITQQGGSFWQPTRLGRDVANDLTPLWEAICSLTLQQDQAQLLSTVNRLSPGSTDSYAWLSDVARDALLAELEWSDGVELLWTTATELEEQDLISAIFTFGANIQAGATYKGLVWESKRGFTLESRFIDDLVREWETTSVEFKREVHLDTADEKAEFIKDLLGLVNTQASGRRWLITGFHPKTREYYGPPDANVTQDRIEQILAHYTAPVVNVRHEVIAYRGGPVGKLEVLRDPRKLPYAVAKSISKTKRVEQGEVFVRHGSQTEHPTPAELQALEAERDRARAMA